MLIIIVLQWSSPSSLEGAPHASQVEGRSMAGIGWRDDLRVACMFSCPEGVFFLRHWSEFEPFGVPLKPVNGVLNVLYWYRPGFVR